MRSASAAERRALAPALLSGFAGLGYQIVWSQQAGLWLGHEAAAALAVIGAFFGGLAVGAAWLGPRIARSAQPRRWVVGAELAIALWGAVLPALLPAAGEALLASIGAQPAPLTQWLLALLGVFVLLLPATAAMGATLPALARAVATAGDEPRGSVAALYAANTAGAVLGVLAAAFWLVPSFGLARTAAACVTLNLLAAALAWRRLPPGPAAAEAPPSSEADAAAGRAALRRLALTGLLGIGYEAVVVRVLSQVDEDTVYTFALLLAVYLAGSAAGAALYRGLRARTDPRLGDRLLLALAGACLLGGASLWAAEGLKAGLLAQAGGGLAAALAAEAALALAAFGLPTIAMGALFGQLADRARAAGVDLGRALALNTLGAACAPPLFGLALAPALGPKAALLIVVAGYLALVSRAAWRTAGPWLPAAATAALALAAPPLAFVDVPEGGRVLSYADGVLGAVSVVEDADGVRRLRINNRQQEGSNASRHVDARQGLLPLLLHPAPRHALFLGLGTGVTAAAAAGDPQVEVDAVELLPEVINAAHWFARDGAADDAVHVQAGDARRVVRADGPRYDVIVADNFHPARSGSGALYTVEHFRAVRARLAAGGVFCQWLPLHQLDLDTLRSIVQSFRLAFPQGTALLASHSLDTPVLGLVARADAAPSALGPLGALRARLAQAAAPLGLAALGLDDDFALLGGFVAGPSALARFAGDAEANTDDRPVVAYRAPRITYAPDSRPRDRLIALLHELGATPAEIVDSGDAAWSARLAAYWQARDRYLQAGRDVQPAPTAAAMLAQVEGPLLAVLRTSPDFRPAYEPLLQMAGRLARSDAPAARRLLGELVAVQPGRDEARLALARLEGGGR